ncbi:hypothetical protein [Embleya sp. NBC_00896]|uniref:hypothetical protein n=1 Tax=Embleya sp. NBC_00896 TaxID=2975961 RepID=UPI002F916956|nr:hypothetical protein OG928_48200 [Embleya sp. NBC_00896]
MNNGIQDYRIAKTLLDRAHHFTYGDGADPVTGHALATEALGHIALAELAFKAACLTPDDMDPQSRREWREAVGIDDRTVHPDAEHDGDEGVFVDPADAQATTP